MNLKIDKQVKNLKEIIKNHSVTVDGECVELHPDALEFIAQDYIYQEGLNNIKDLNMSLKLKTILSTMVLSFGGLSSHMQIYSIISETNIKYKPFLISRIVHSLLSGLFIYLLF